MTYRAEKIRDFPEPMLNIVPHLPPTGALNVQAIPTAHPVDSNSTSRPSFEKNAEYWHAAVNLLSNVATIAPICTKGP